MTTRAHTADPFVVAAVRILLLAACIALVLVCIGCAEANAAPGAPTGVQQTTNRTPPTVAPSEQTATPAPTPAPAPTGKFTFHIVYCDPAGSGCTPIERAELTINASFVGYTNQAGYVYTKLGYGGTVHAIIYHGEYVRADRDVPLREGDEFVRVVLAKLTR